MPAPYPSILSALEPFSDDGLLGLHASAHLDRGGAQDARLYTLKHVGRWECHDNEGDWRTRLVRAAPTAANLKPTSHHAQGSARHW